MSKDGPIRMKKRRPRAMRKCRGLFLVSGEWALIVQTWYDCLPNTDPNKKRGRRSERCHDDSEAHLRRVSAFGDVAEAFTD